MPSRLKAPVLTLDVAKMHEINPRNIESLFGMWTVFSKCSQSIKDGSRLENLSWRIWARETLCCPPQPEKTIVPAIDIPVGRSSEVPSLSNSPGSDDSHSDEETSSRKVACGRTLPLYDEGSALSKSRGKETHLTPSALEKIVVTIQEKPDLTPLSPALEASLPPLKDPNDPNGQGSDVRQHDNQEDTTKHMQNSTDSCISGTTVTTTNTTNTRKSDHRSSDTSVSSDGLIRSGSVVRGFSPVSTSFRAKAMGALPVPASSKLVPVPSKKQGMFQLGASSEDDESSFEQKVSTLRPRPGRSSLSQSLTKPSAHQGLDKKKTSFRDIVEQRRIHSDAENDEGAIASSDEEDESAIDEEDDEEGWEDSNSDDESKAPPQQPLAFRRVDSRPELVSRPSMLSMQLEQKRRASGLQHEVSSSMPAYRHSRETSVNGPSAAGSPEDDDEDEDGGLMMRGNAQARPIMMPPAANQRSVAHSPRTTRQHMLSTELTESLRKNLLWERQQKSQTVNAFLKRNRNAQSMANLQGAGRANSVLADQRNNNSWKEEFENPWEFNAKGW